MVREGSRQAMTILLERPQPSLLFTEANVDALLCLQLLKVWLVMIAITVFLWILNNRLGISLSVAFSIDGSRKHKELPCAQQHRSRQGEQNAVRGL